MSSRAFRWLSEPDVRELVDRIPLAIALATHDGTVEFANKRFGERYGRVASVRELGPRAVAGPESEPMRFAREDGDELKADARAIAIHDGVMLVVGEAPAPDAEMSALRSRIAELEVLSATDGLTGVWNRTHLNGIIDFELGRALRLREPISLVLVDVDRFKDVNDSCGHQAGDAVLRELVAVLRANVRPSDALFRWGGDEFLLLSVATGYRSGEALAERLRSAVRRHRFPAAEAQTVSIGVAEYLAPETSQAWFARTDSALYAAKRGGRDRVHVDRRGNSDEWASAAGGSALQLVWQEAYQCGEPAIDDAHRELFTLGNAAIAAATIAQNQPGALNRALDALIAHVARHFADEEAVLERLGYARLDAHRQAHAGLLARAYELRVGNADGPTSLGRLVDYLADDVVARHVFTMDRDFFPLFEAFAAAERPGT